MSIITLYRSLLVLATFVYLPYCQADCTASSETTSFGTLSSFTVAATAQTVESGSGFTCSGSLLSLLSTNTVSATIASSGNASGNTPRLYSASTGNAIPYTLCKDSSCSSSYNIGDSITWSSTTLLGLLGLFNSSDGSLPIYLKTSTGANVAAGTYTDTITLNWDYKICFVGVLGICAYTTGTATTTITLTLVVTNDCYIDSAPDVSFGTAALPSEFTAVSNAISVRCTLNAAYSVNLSGNNANSGNWRQMLAIVNGSNQYLQYQLYRSDGSAWTSSNDYSVVGTGLAQSLTYSAAVNAGQNNQPAGSYSDIVTVTVTY